MLRAPVVLPILSATMFLLALPLTVMLCSRVL
jgi:hypothetical protein